MPIIKTGLALHIVWWLWLAAALLALPLPIEFALALGTRGLDSVRSSGIDGDGFAMLNLSGALAVLSVPLLAILTPLYVFLFWSARLRGAHTSARFWVPIYGSLLLVLTISVMALALRS